MWGEWDRMRRPCVINHAVFDEAYQRVLNGEIAPFKLMQEMSMKRSAYYNYKHQYEYISTSVNVDSW